jgi:predicted nucleotidyltransferase
MVSTRQQALEIAAKARQALAEIYDGRLRGVYLYGSAARDELTADSDIDIAVVLDQIPDRFDEHERTSQLASDLSLEYDTLIAFLFVTEADFADGTFLVYRTIRREGIPA